ncbi:hypothetical protein BU17DRAFT_59792 [Hysterangium stoloniferum]|nr:hypothetical protein BU17DRAFT_59792 [Hysterangium stoloniferum]
MPGTVNQPIRASDLGLRLSTYTAARSLPSSVWSTLQNNERSANVILPHALISYDRDYCHDQWWITCETTNDRNTPPCLEFILSCTTWHMGTYPIFIICTSPRGHLSLAHLAPRMAALAVELQSCVPVERVYSIFAATPIAKSFAQAWSNITGVELEKKLYYSAQLTYCSQSTLIKNPILANDLAYRLRLATEQDIQKVAILCYEFASTSEPFILTRDEALKEAAYLVSNKMGWVHEIFHGSSSDIACVVATTRNSKNVGTISKVYTSQRWRRHGCAERLVRHVCEHLLNVERKQWVALYVSHENRAAEKVYDKVGFVGLCGKDRVEGVEDWVEIGFGNARLGHW